ncbi:MAG: hypothetical protein QXN77_09480 [Candidatus Caldarchaeum sp.]
MAERGRPSAFRSRRHTLLRILDIDYKGAAKLDDFVREAAYRCNVATRTIYRDIERIRRDLLSIGGLSFIPITITRHRGHNVIHLPNVMVGLELVGTLIAIIASTATGVVALIYHLFETAFHIGLSLTTLLIPLSFRYLLYRKVRSSYYPELMKPANHAGKRVRRSSAKVHAEESGSHI